MAKPRVGDTRVREFETRQVVAVVLDQKGERLVAERLPPDADIDQVASAKQAAEAGRPAQEMRVAADLFHLGDLPKVTIAQPLPSVEQFDQWPPACAQG